VAVPGDTKTPAEKRPRHWYRQYVGECPVCGRDQSYRVRVEGERPERAEDRYVYLPHSVTYCGCMRA
jgi:hypothetical protein